MNLGTGTVKLIECRISRLFPKFTQGWLDWIELSCTLIPWRSLIEGLILGVQCNHVSPFALAHLAKGERRKEKVDIQRHIFLFSTPISGFEYQKWHKRSSRSKKAREVPKRNKFPRSKDEQAFSSFTSIQIESISLNLEEWNARWTMTGILMDHNDRKT